MKNEPTPKELWKTMAWLWADARCLGMYDLAEVYKASAARLSAERGLPHG